MDRVEKRAAAAGVDMDGLLQFFRDITSWIPAADEILGDRRVCLLSVFRLLQGGLESFRKFSENPDHRHYISPYGWLNLAVSAKYGRDTDQVRFSPLKPPQDPVAAESLQAIGDQAVLTLLALTGGMLREDKPNELGTLRFLTHAPLKEWFEHLKGPGKQITLRNLREGTFIGGPPWERRGTAWHLVEGGDRWGMGRWTRELGKLVQIQTQIEDTPCTISPLLTCYPLEVPEGKEEGLFHIYLSLFLHSEDARVQNQFFIPTGSVDEKPVWDAILGHFVDAPEPEPEVVQRQIFGVSFGSTIVSPQALAIAQAAGNVRLPKKWSTIPRWEDLVETEIARLLDEEGDRAFQDLRKQTRDPDERGALLKKQRKAGGGERIELTAEAQNELKQSRGRKAYIDLDQWGRECLVRRFEVGNGSLEVGLSWMGLAGPLVDQWREEFKKQTEEIKKKQETLSLFKDLNEKQQRRVDRMMEQIRLWEDGRRVMNMIITQVSIQCQNPVEIDADTFRVLLWPDRAKTGDWPQNWRQRVEGALSGLQALTFNYQTYRTEKLKGYGGFLGEWDYVGRGRGGHGEGVYILDVQPGFLGCLKVFESGKTQLRSGRDAVTYNFRQLSKEERKALVDAGGYRQIADAGRPFYDAAAQLTQQQESLLNFIEHNLTLKSNTARKEDRAKQVKKSAPDAQEKRLYDHQFCPLLPENGSYFGGLGHFKRHAEIGFKLLGTESELARHSGGLLEVMGYRLPQGGARAERRRIVTDGLDQIQAAVVDYLGGVVATWDGNNWRPLDQIRELDITTLRRIRLFIFLPRDYEKKRRAQWEEKVDRKATESPEEAERAAWGDLDHVEEEEGEGVQEPLYIQLKTTAADRGVHQKDLADLFGVSGMTVSYWVNGKKPIPEEVVPWVKRWIDTGEGPTPAELAGRKTRRTGVKNGKTGASK